MTIFIKRLKETIAPTLKWAPNYTRDEAAFEKYYAFAHPNNILALIEAYEIVRGELSISPECVCFGCEAARKADAILEGL